MHSDLSQFYHAFVAQGLDNLAPELTIRLKSMLERNPTTKETEQHSETNEDGIMYLSPRATASGSDPIVPDVFDGTQLHPDNAEILAYDSTASRSSSDSPHNADASSAVSRLSQRTSAGEQSDDFFMKLEYTTPSLLFIDSVGWTSSFAWTEKTFGRRVQRAAIEAACELVRQPVPNMDYYNAIFGFCLRWESTEQIRNRMFRLVARSALETLDDWEFPFASIASAGHLAASTPLNEVPRGAPGTPDFLPMGNYGTYRTPANRVTFDVEPFMGPFRSYIENARDTYLDDHMHIKLPNFDGPFLDCNDAELYLRLRGIIIPGSVDYITALIDLNDFMPATVEPKGTVPYMVPGPSKTRWQQAQHSVPITSMNLESFLSETDLGGIVGTMGNGSSYSSSPSAAEPKRPAQTSALCSDNSASMQGMKMKVSIDVNRLVSREYCAAPYRILTLTLGIELVESSVCLGRAPGIRPSHINRAVRLAATPIP